MKMFSIENNNAAQQYSFSILWNMKSLLHLDGKYVVKKMEGRTLMLYLASEKQMLPF